MASKYFQQMSSSEDDDVIDLNDESINNSNNKLKKHQIKKKYDDLYADEHDSSQTEDESSDPIRHGNKNKEDILTVIESSDESEDEESENEESEAEESENDGDQTSRKQRERNNLSEEPSGESIEETQNETDDDEDEEDVEFKKHKYRNINKIVSDESEDNEESETSEDEEEEKVISKKIHLKNKNIVESEEDDQTHKKINIPTMVNDSDEERVKPFNNTNARQQDALKSKKHVAEQLKELGLNDTSLNETKAGNKQKSMESDELVCLDSSEEDEQKSKSNHKYRHESTRIMSQNIPDFEDDDIINDSIIDDDVIIDNKNEVTHFEYKPQVAAQKQKADMLSTEFNKEEHALKPSLEEIKAKIKVEPPKKTQLIEPQGISNTQLLNDLRNPSAAFTGNTQMRNRNLGFEEQLRSLSKIILRELESKPDQGKLDDVRMPDSLNRNVKLMDHQMYALKWLKWREKTEPNGAILADDMGLGKTLTILSYLALKKQEYEEKVAQEEEEQDENENDSDNEHYSKKKSSNRRRREVPRLKTLIILPASLLHQWKGEIDNRFQRNTFKYHVYHDAGRKKNCYNMDDNDIVFTTYEIATREVNPENTDESPLSKIKWKRVILDEAHRIKNPNAKATKNICSIRCKYRIAITGTPIQNSLDDFYSLVKFLRLEPLDDRHVWKYVMAEESSKAKVNQNSQVSQVREKRLNSWLHVLSELLILRRCKTDTKFNSEEKIVDLPNKDIKIVKVKLIARERFIYDKIFKESKEKFKKLLISKQRGTTSDTTMSDILVYLLRLRQACCHMSLLSEVLDKSELQSMKCDAEGLDGLMENLTINKDSSTQSQQQNDFKVEDLAGMEDVLKRKFLSSKCEVVMKMIDEILDNHPEDKMIIVSQWTSMLRVIGRFLERREVEYCEINGEVKLAERNEIVQQFNKPRNTQIRVMLLSLNAGGVGLNLVGANRMFLIDIHWNPALERQACDRIFRVGQTKDVEIFRFLCEETIEERIEQIQQAKIAIAEKVCSTGGSKSNAVSAKLTLNDMKLLFADFHKD